MGTSTRCCEIIEMRADSECDRQPFGDGRTANVTSADEQYVQSKFLVMSYDVQTGAN